MTHSRILVATLSLIIMLGFAPTDALAAGTGTIDASSLSAASAKPTLTGEVHGYDKVRITVVSAKGKTVFKSRNIREKNDVWKSRVSKSLAAGNYEVTLFGMKGSKKTQLARETLSVLGKTGKGAGTLSVSSIPLLTGGMAAPGSAVPVAYIKVVNTGTSQASVTNFVLSENGSAPDDLVIGFITSDDKGGSRAVIGGTEGTKEFRNGTASVPLAYTFAPGEFRIFTIKAQVSSKSAASAGSQLMINVAGIDSTAKVSGAFPIRGTTWTLSR